MVIQDQRSNQPPRYEARQSQPRSIGLWNPRSRKCETAQRRNVERAAREAHVSRERLAAYAKHYAGADFKGGRWTFDDQRKRRVYMAATGEHNLLTLKVPGYDPSSLAGLHFTESRAVLENPDLHPAFIAKWAGVSIPAPIRRCAINLRQH